MNIGIIDYKYCSLLPIYSSIKSFNVKTTIIQNSKDIKIMDKIVLPGVGATNKIMDFLIVNNYIEEIQEFAQHNKAILGICAGMQIMAKKLHENENKSGLGFFNSEVKKIDNDVSEKKTNIGWIDTTINNKKISYYYCHSFYMNFQKKDDECIKGFIDLKSKIPSMIKKNNLIGVQFHPEKSQTNGRKFISNFINDRL